ncbi:MAG TPA: ATP-binding protein [Acidobacteriaceae bacterium]
MRRRSRRDPNTSESTGKIGHELPSNQPRPLVPLYPDDAAVPVRATPGALLPGESRSLPPRPEPAPRPDTAPREARDRREERRDSRRDDRSTQRPPAARREPPAYAESPEPGRFEMETQPDTPSALPEETAPAGGATQEPKGFVVLAIGLPGSGKTTWFKRRGVTPLSSDMLRTILFDDITEQRYQGLVFSTLRSILRARLIAHMPWNYVDATNLSAHERRQWIKMAASFGYDVQAVFFDVPLSVCLERNSKRDRPVSEEVMQKMAERLKPPAFDEGFSKITVVRVKSSA